MNSSPEDVIRGLYRRILERAATADEVRQAYELTDLDHTVRTKALSLALSPEHRARFHDGRPDDQVARSLYRHFLAREPTQTEINNYAFPYFGYDPRTRYENAVRGIIKGAEYDLLFGEHYVPDRPPTLRYAVRKRIITLTGLDEMPVARGAPYTLPYTFFPVSDVFQGFRVFELRKVGRASWSAGWQGPNVVVSLSVYRYPWIRFYTGFGPVDEVQLRVIIYLE